MNQVYTNNVAIFYPSGFLDGNSAASFFSPQDASDIILKKPEAVFISLKKISFFNKKGLSYLVEKLIFVKNEYDVFVGFCDYDTKKYDLILKIFKDKISFSLIENEDILFLFAGKKSFKSKNVIIYLDDCSQKNQIAIYLVERKLNVKIAHNRKEFELQKDKYDFVICNSYLGNIEKIASVYIKKNIIVYTLNDFLDSTIFEIFDMNYYTNSVKIGFRIFCFDVSEVSSVNVHGANFLSKLAIDGAELGVKIFVCGLSSEKITKRLSDDLEDAGISLFGNINSFFDKINADKDEIERILVKKSALIDKKIVSVLPNFIDISIHLIEILSNKKVIKNDIKIQELNITKKRDFMVSVIGLYGDIDAAFMLIIDKNDVKDICKILLSQNFSNDDLIYAFGEFATVIGSKLKQFLRSIKIEVKITMPRVFNDISEVEKLEIVDKGIQANFKIKDRDIILFLSK